MNEEDDEEPRGTNDIFDDEEMMKYFKHKKFEVNTLAKEKDHILQQTKKREFICIGENSFASSLARWQQKS